MGRVLAIRSLALFIKAVAVHQLVEIDLMAVKIRAVDTCKFHLAADLERQPPHMPVPSTMIGLSDTSVLMP